MEACDLKELKDKDWLALTWGFIWRSFLVSLLSVALGAALGFLFSLGFGKLLESMGRNVEDYRLMLQVLGVTEGLLLGFASTYFYIKWLLKSKIGGFRLQLVRAR